MPKASTKILIPGDRTQKQPVRAFCGNPECREQSDQRFEFDAQHEAIECPKCGANQSPMVGLVALIHFLHRQKGGPIVGSGGLRYALACDSNRAYLATATNQEAASGDLSVANCPGCLQAAVEKQLIPIQGAAVRPGN